MMKLNLTLEILNGKNLFYHYNKGPNGGNLEEL
jgi:hypothetical protein